MFIVELPLLAAEGLEPLECLSLLSSAFRFPFDTAVLFCLEYQFPSVVESCDCFRYLFCYLAAEAHNIHQLGYTSYCLWVFIKFSVEAFELFDALLLLLSCFLLYS